MRPRELAPLAAVVVVMLVTAAWWALALWPLPADAPAWVTRTRLVCFGNAGNGLPTTAGWVVLVGEPVAMLGALFAVWGGAIRNGAQALAARVWGRAVLRSAALALALGVAAVAWRVGTARAATTLAFPDGVAENYPRLDREAPPIRLVDQRGDTVTLASFRGRPVLLTFAYAHCETVCPLLVRDVVEARRRSGDVPVALVVTLDPWRDVPARLPAVARRWGLRGDERVLSGSVDDVQAVLDDWNVARARNARTGEIAHPNLVYVVDPEGLLAYAAVGGVDRLVALVERL